MVGVCRRCRGGGPGCLLGVGAQGGGTDGPPAIAADPKFWPGVCRIPAGLSCVLRIHLLRHAIFPEYRGMVSAAHRPVLALFLHSVFSRCPDGEVGGAAAAGRLGRGVGLPHRRRGRVWHEPADDGDAVCVGGCLLRPGGGGLRADGPGDLDSGHGLGSRGIIGDRVRPVQCLPPDRHRDGTGHPRIHRRQRDPGRLAPAVRVFPASRAASAAQAGADVAGGQVHAAAAFVGRLALDPAKSSFLRGFALALLLAGAILATAGLVGLPGPTAPRQPRVPATPASRCEDAPLSRVGTRESSTAVRPTLPATGPRPGRPGCRARRRAARPKRRTRPRGGGARPGPLRRRRPWPSS